MTLGRTRRSSSKIAETSKGRESVTNKDANDGEPRSVVSIGLLGNRAIGTYHRYGHCLVSKIVIEVTGTCFDEEKTMRAGTSERAQLQTGANPGLVYAFAIEVKKSHEGPDATIQTSGP